MSDKLTYPNQSNLSYSQKARIERSRAKALNLRQAKLVTHPYPNPLENDQDIKHNGNLQSVIKVQGTKYIDSGGGFLLDQPVLESNLESTAKINNAEIDDVITIPVTYEECLECGDHFADSFLFNNFSYAVCDKCRDPDVRHSLITRTEAKAEYLLKDCDIDKREPPLRYISRKNPHNIRWGEMKLYLHLQVEQRAMAIWGSEEKLLQQHESREQKREVTKIRKFNKEMKKLRMEVRSSLYTKDSSALHKHEFGPESYDKQNDNYTHSCLSCPYTETYEKL